MNGILSLPARILRRARPALAVFAVAAAITMLQVAAKEPRYPIADELDYVDIALDLNRIGTFTNGGMGPAGDPDRPGMFFAPAVPAYIAVLVALDDRLAATLTCLRLDLNTARARCPPDYGVFLWVQGALAALGLSLVWYVARRMGLPAAVAWLAMLLVAASGRYAYYATHFLTEIPLIVAYGVFTLLLLAASDRPTLRRWALAGVAVGLCALVRPSYLYLVYATAAAAALWLAVCKRGVRVAGVAGLGVLAGAAVLVLPWMIRNAVLFEQFALTAGYAPFTLSQRVAYNMMTWQEWAAAWLYWLPDFGDTLATRLFGAATVARLDFATPDGFYLHGLGRFYVDTASAAAALGRDHLSYLLAEHVAGDFWKHVAFTLVLAWRGMWVAKYFGLVGHLLSVGAWAIAVRRGLVRPFAVVALPCFFMLGLHAFVSVSIPRYSIVMLPYLMIAAAVVLHAIFLRVGACRLAGGFFRRTGV